MIEKEKRVYQIKEFKTLNSPENYVLTQHSMKRLRERGISIRNIVDAINNGAIIEQYVDDFPFPSCLISGKSESKNIHVVASIDGDMIYIITAYIPDSRRWEEDYRTRKEKGK